MNRILPADYRMYSTVNRKFWVILGLSALLHGSLFTLTHWQRQSHRATPLPLVASLRLMPQPAGADRTPPPATPPRPTAQPVAAKVTAPLRQAAPVHPVVPLPAAASAPVSAPIPTSEPAPPAAESKPLVSVPAVTPVVASERPSAPARSDPLADYRRQLTDLFARMPEYPRIAAMRGWEGEVRLRLKVARKGNLIGVALDRSSGFDVLDQHALALLEGHGSLPPLPESLEASEIQVVVPVHYRLKKAT